MIMQSEECIKQISGLSWEIVSRNAIMFAEACYNDNNMVELSVDHGPDKADWTDLTTWEISAEEWSWAIETARQAKLYGFSIDGLGRLRI